MAAAGEGSGGDHLRLNRAQWRSGSGPRVERLKERRDGLPVERVYRQPARGAAQTSALGGISPQESVPVHDADIKAGIVQRPERPFGQEDLDQHALGHGSRFKRAGGSRAVDDGAGPS